MGPPVSSASPPSRGVGGRTGGQKAPPHPTPPPPRPRPVVLSVAVQQHSSRPARPIWWVLIRPVINTPPIPIRGHRASGCTPAQWGKQYILAASLPIESAPPPGAPVRIRHRPPIRLRFPALAAPQDTGHPAPGAVDVPADRPPHHPTRWTVGTGPVVSI